MRNIALDDLRAEIGDCLSQEQIFEGTLLENIAMGRPAVNIEDVNWAVDNVGLRQFVAGLPDGYRTRLQPHGKTLARSVVQQILIARAIVDRPRLLLLENIFENLEIGLRESIIDFLLSDEHTWTLVVATNDSKFISKASRVITMDEGQVMSDR